MSQTLGNRIAEIVDRETAEYQPKLDEICERLGIGTDSEKLSKISERLENWVRDVDVRVRWKSKSLPLHLYDHIVSCFKDYSEIPYKINSIDIDRLSGLSVNCGGDYDAYVKCEKIHIYDDVVKYIIDKDYNIDIVFDYDYLHSMIYVDSEDEEYGVDFCDSIMVQLYYLGGTDFLLIDNQWYHKKDVYIACMNLSEEYVKDMEIKIRTLEYGSGPCTLRVDEEYLLLDDISRFDKTKSARK